MRVLAGLLTVVLCAAVPAGLLLVVSLTVTSIPLILVPILAALMAGYGLFAAILGSYHLGTPKGWLMLIIDLTWSLPNTIFGAVIGIPLYLIFGKPSKADSRDQGWISFQPRSTTGFGNNVLQTLGTINLGGPGQHERMHLLQARIFGPLYLPLFALCYVITFVIQGLFTLILGLILKATGVRNKAALQPPSSSAVKGFWGWVYYATLFEVWAYASGNP